MVATAWMYPTTVASTAGTTWATTTNATGSTAGTNATFTNVTSGGVGTIQLSGYNAQANTNGGVQPTSVDSVDVTVANFVGTVARTASITVQLYTGTTAIGSPTALTIALTPNVQTVTLTGANAPTWAQMSDLRAQVVFTRAAVTTANVFSLDYVGVAVNYTVPGLPKRFTGSSTSSATTVNTVTTISSAVAVGTLAFVSYASWGYGSVSAPVVTIADSKGNTWTNNVDVRTSAVGAIEVWSTVLTTAWAAADTVTVTSVGDVGLQDYAMAVDVIAGYTNVGAQAGTLTSSTSTAPSSTLTPSGSPTSALVYGFLSVMTTAPTITEDADTAGGDSWHGLPKLTTATVGRLIELGGAAKISTPGSTVQTYNPTLSASQLWESVVVLFPPAPGITAVGALVEVSGTTGQTAVTVTPTAIGNLIGMVVTYGSTTITVSSITGGSCTNWTLVAAQSDATAVQRAELWVGTANSTSATAATITYSSAIGAISVGRRYREFTAGLGASTAWSIDKQSGIDNASSTTITYPSLTATGSGELYFGYAFATNTPTAGSTSGFTWTAGSNGNFFIHNTAVSGTVSPTNTQSPAGVSFAVAGLLTATTAAATPVFRAASTVVATGQVTSLTVPVPAGVINGDLMLLYGINDHVNDYSTPAGWTPVLALSDVTTAGAAVFSRFASSEPASYVLSDNVNPGSPDPAAACIVAYSGATGTGATATGPLSGANSATSPVPNVPTPIAATDMVVRFYGFGDQTISGAVPADHTLTGPGSPWTSRVNMATAIPSMFQTGAVVVEAPASTGAPTASMAFAATKWVVVTVVVQGQSGVNRKLSCVVITQAVNRAATY